MWPSPDITYVLPEDSRHDAAVRRPVTTSFLPIYEVVTPNLREEGSRMEMNRGENVHIFRARCSTEPRPLLVQLVPSVAVMYKR